MMKKIYFIFGCLLWSLILLGQNETIKLIKDEQGIQIFAREIECHDNQNGIHQAFYSLQFVNTTNESIHLTWNIDYWMNGVCVTCNSPKTAENTYSLYLEPGETYEGSCEKHSLRGTKIYIRELYNPQSSVLSKFEIVNLQINFN